MSSLSPQKYNPSFPINKKVYVHELNKIVFLLLALLETRFLLYSCFKTNSPLSFGILFCFVPSGNCRESDLYSLTLIVVSETEKSRSYTLEHSYKIPSRSFSVNPTIVLLMGFFIMSDFLLVMSSLSTLYIQ